MSTFNIFVVQHSGAVVESTRSTRLHRRAVRGGLWWEALDQLLQGPAAAPTYGQRTHLDQGATHVTHVTHNHRCAHRLAASAREPEVHWDGVRSRRLFYTQDQVKLLQPMPPATRRIRRQHRVPLPSTRPRRPCGASSSPCTSKQCHRRLPLCQALQQTARSIFTRAIGMRSAR